jgi:serine/threonine-protein kinase
VGTHVASVTDAGQLDSGLPYLVMEHLTGETLAARLEAQGPVPIREAVDYVLQACEGVAEAHGLGIVHRDLKPDNLFLHSAAGCAPFVKVLDFGVSKYTDPDAVQLTTSNMLIGSLSYMSPEQARNAKRVDKRTDVWALGVILYELVTGRVPFPGTSLFDVLMSITTDEPPLPRLHRPDLPAGLEAVILRCLEKDIERRVQSIAELVQALAPFGSAMPVRYPLESVPPPADPVSSPPPPPVDDEPSSIRLRPVAKPRGLRWPWLVLVAACAAGLASIAAMGASGWVSGDAQAQRTIHAAALLHE